MTFLFCGYRTWKGEIRQGPPPALVLGSCSQNFGGFGLRAFFFHQKQRKFFKRVPSSTADMDRTLSLLHNKVRHWHLACAFSFLDGRDCGGAIDVCVYALCLRCIHNSTQPPNFLPYTLKSQVRNENTKLKLDYLTTPSSPVVAESRPRFCPRDSSIRRSLHRTIDHRHRSSSQGGKFDKKKPQQP